MTIDGKTDTKEVEKGKDGYSRLASVDVIASDYDRTLTQLDLSLSPETISAVDSASRKGISIVIVSGRGLRFMTRMSQMFERVDALVAENGAVVSYDGEIRRLSHRTGDMIADALTQQGVPFIKGEVISYIARGDLPKAVDAIPSMSGYAKLVKNVDSGMVLPLDVDKDSGLMVALQLMGKKLKNTLVVGDGENDISLFTTEALKIALGNSVPQIKEKADIVLNAPAGEGFVQLIGRLLSSRDK